MRVTIVKSDSIVVVDGVVYAVDCTSLPTDFHALQWYGQSGEVEYTATQCEHCGARTKKGNAVIRDLTPYQPYVDAWGQAKVAAEAAAREKEQANAAAGPQS